MACQRSRRCSIFSRGLQNTCSNNRRSPLTYIHSSRAPRLVSQTIRSISNAKCEITFLITSSIGVESISRCQVNVPRKAKSSDTISLRRHYEKMHPTVERTKPYSLTSSNNDNKSSQRMLTSSAQLVSSEDAKKLVTCWLAETTLPFAVVEHRLFRMIAHPDILRHLPKTSTSISRNIGDHVVNVKAKLIQYIGVSAILHYVELIFLQTLPGCVHLSLDGWTSENGNSFQGFILHGLDPNKEEPLVTITLEP